jgi:hypothetical protein
VRSIAYQKKRFGLGQLSGRLLRTAKRAVRQQPTTRAERLLLMATTVMYPLQSHIPAVGGFSSLYFIFAAMAVYVLLNRSRALAQIWSHPIFMAAYTLLILGFLIESLHPYPMYSELFRVMQMIVGGIFVAALCRDRKSLRAGFYGYLVASIGMSILLFLTGFGILREATSADFVGATSARIRAIRNNPLEGDANAMAFTTAQGISIALALALTARTSLRRYLFLGIALFCLVASFIPMSRSGTLSAVLSCAAVLFAFRRFAPGVKYMRAVVVAAVLCAGVLMWVPNVVFSRLTASTQTNITQVDGRARLYSAAFEHLPEYIITGVGQGNFFNSWGWHSKFLFRDGPSVPHSTFIDVILYWGLVGFLALLMVVYQAYRSLPKHCGRDPLSICLLGIAVSVFVWSFFAPVLAAKEYSLALGILAGANRWVWPQRIVYRTARQRRLYPLSEYAS